MTAGLGGAVPVLMYHSVGRVLDDWAWSELTVPARVFEDHLRWLARAGYRTADFYELHAHTTGEAVLPPKTVVLTFDDGYVDNWTYVAPLLRQYGFTGTVLVTPEFVDPREVVRPTLADVRAGLGSEDGLEVRGFMSWAELGEASESGALSVQSHAMTHTWYPTGDRVVDFHHPGDRVYWLDWNHDAESKWDYLRDPDATKVAYGTPIYEHGKSLESRRYHPDVAEAEHLAGYVDGRGGRAFFERPSWRGELERTLESFRSGRTTSGRYETDEERAQRVDYELLDSKREIEARLGRGVDFFVWPGGGYDEAAMSRAREIYRAVTISTPDRWRLRNRPGERPGEIVRRGVPEVPVAGTLRFPGGRYLIEFLEEYRGSRVARRRRQAMLLLYMGAGRLGLWR